MFGRFRRELYLLVGRMPDFFEWSENAKEINQAVLKKLWEILKLELEIFCI